MKIKDTISMMTSENYKERFKGEYLQLKIRIEKFEVMLSDYKASTLPFKPACSYELLFEQLVYMKNYLRVLEKRADIEKINIK